MSKALGAVAALLAGLGLSAPAAAQAVAADAGNGYSSPCQLMAGQVEIDGYLQQVVGLACLQPDGSWQMVDSSGGGVVYAQPAYYYDPWYWTPVGVGFGASFIFVDRFHHAHNMHRVFLPRPGGGFRGGFHGGSRGSFVGAPRGGFQGGFHGGGHHH